MLNTIGILILTFQAMMALPSPTTSNNDITQAFPSKKYQKIQISETELKQYNKAIIDHYNTKSEWAGTFQIDRIVKTRIEKISNEKSIAHVRYHYVPVPNNPKLQTISGYDQRKFSIVVKDSVLKVIKMDRHNSALF